MEKSKSTLYQLLQVLGMSDDFSKKVMATMDTEKDVALMTEYLIVNRPDSEEQILDALFQLESAFSA